MFLTFEDRPSNAPYVERFWRCYSTRGGLFHSMAEGNLELVVTRLDGFVQVTLRGPVTQAATVDCPANGQWFVIRFRVGTYFPGLPTVRAPSACCTAVGPPRFLALHVLRRSGTSVRGLVHSGGRRMLLATRLARPR